MARLPDPGPGCRSSPGGRAGAAQSVEFQSGWPRAVRIVEVGARDGLQNESVLMPTAIKVAFLRKLAEAGFAEVEATSFVHPVRVPQLADAAEVVAALSALEAPIWTVLVPNERGLERALAAGARRIAVFTAAADAFAERNLGMDVRTSLETIRKVTARARAAGVTVRGYVSTAFVCPFSGEVDPHRVRDVAGALLEMGADEVSLGDTLGVAVPTDVWRLLEVVGDGLPTTSLALHFHDTSGTALANVLAGLQAGIATYDSSAGGLGGCPFAPGASGNLATEDLVYFLDHMGVRTGISLPAVVLASAFLEQQLGRSLPSRQYRRLRAHDVRHLSVREGDSASQGE